MSGIGITTQTPETRCPVCNVIVTAATGFGHKSAPHAGSVTICIECAGILVFVEGLKLRVATPEERTTLLAENPELRALLRAVRARIALSGNAPN